METVGELIVRYLQRNKIRAIQGYPGEQMLAITSPMAAVTLYELNPKEEKATLLVSVLSPANRGAGAAEYAAVDVLMHLEAFGCACRQEKVKYLSAPEWFCVEIYATLNGTQRETWISAPEEETHTFHVTLARKERSYTKSFEAFREVEEGISVENVHWRFRLEELFPLEEREPDMPMEDFDVVVTREGRLETYSNCRIYSQSRKLTAEGQKQILEGIATELTVQ